MLVKLQSEISTAIFLCAKIWSSVTSGSELAKGWAAQAPRGPGQIQYRVEHISSATSGVASALDEDKDTSNTGDSVVMEYAELRLTREAFESGVRQKAEPTKISCTFKRQLIHHGTVPCRKRSAQVYPPLASEAETVVAVWRTM
jgi:hypothetical protein